MDDLGDAFTASLLACGPHAGIPAESRIFAPFIGSWDLVVSWFDPEGRLTRTLPGEWHFSWVLEGRAIQDVWIVPPRGDRASGTEVYEYGTSLRFYDPTLNAWRSTWIGPVHGVVRTFLARQLGDEVVLQTTDGSEPRMRWSFSDVTPRSFDWCNEIWERNTWRRQQSFRCRRRQGPPRDEGAPVDGRPA